MHASICDFLLDIVQNSIEAAATLVEVSIKESRKSIAFVVKDNGKGMSEETLKKVTDPFYTDGEKHVHRKIGLGLPFLIQAIEAVGGKFSITSQVGVGTTVSFNFLLDAIDSPPMGDLVATMVAFLTFGDEKHQLLVERELTLEKQQESYEIDRLELLDLLGDFSTVGNLKLLKSFIESQEAALNEIR